MDALVFDFDGLILDTETSLYASTAAVFDDHGVHLDASWWAAEILGRADHQHWTEMLAERLGRPLDDVDGLMAARNLRYHEALAEEAIRPGVVELLVEAAERGVPCAVASSSPREWVEGHLERLELAHWFVAVRTRDDVEPGRAKPAPDLYLAACRGAGGEPARCVALEDAPQGIASARAAGMKVVGVAAGLTSELPLDGADLVVPSLAEVTFEGLAALVEP